VIARRLRFLLVFATTLVVGWLVAFPAMAAGPMCDDRGASAIAPSPTMVTAHATLEASVDDDCLQRFLDRVSDNNGRVPMERTEVPDSQAVLPTPAVLAPSLARVLPPLEADFGSESTGVHSRIERPPRP
jgi:hypothetical protein